MQNDLLTRQIIDQAESLGFSLVGVAPAVAPPGMERYDEWLAKGYAGEMAYLVDRREAYEHPDRLLDGARSVVMLALDYKTV